MTQRTGLIHCKRSKLMEIAVFVSLMEIAAPLHANTHSWLPHNYATPSSTARKGPEVLSLISEYRLFKIKGVHKHSSVTILGGRWPVLLSSDDFIMCSYFCKSLYPYVCLFGFLVVSKTDFRNPHTGSGSIFVFSSQRITQRVQFHV